MFPEPASNAPRMKLKPCSAFESILKPRQSPRNAEAKP